MKIAKLLKKIAILVLVLLVPGFLYYLLTAHGKNRYKPLSYFGPKVVGRTTHKVKGKDIPDTLYHKVSDFNLTDQNGKPVSFKTFGNKIIVVNFFYTHCPTICKQVNDNVDSLLSNYKKNSITCFASITVDPERDTPAALSAYAKGYHQPDGKRLFLTGDTSTIYSLARKGLLVNATQTGKDEFIYSDKLILLDPDKHIRGYYSGTSITEVNRLNDEIKVLIAEELRKKEKPLY